MVLNQKAWSALVRPGTSLIFRGLSGASNREEAMRQTQNMLNVDYISLLAWERSRIPQEELKHVAEERDVWVSLLEVLL